MARPYFCAGALSLAVLAAVFISKLLAGETSHQNSQIPPKMLRYVIKHASNTKFHPQNLLVLPNVGVLE